MPITNVRLDGVPATWVSRLVPHPPAAQRPRAINGGHKSYRSERGWWFELQCGDSELAAEEGFEELRTAYENTTNGIVLLEYVDGDGSEVAVDCIWDEDVAAAFRWGNQAERFTVNIYESASGTPFTRNGGSS